MINKNNRKYIIIAGIFIILLLFIISIPYYLTYIAPFNRTIVTVDGESVSMRDFLKRVITDKSDPMAMLQSITNEQLIKQAAPGFGIKVTDENIDDELRRIASNGGEDLSDIEFREWYRQQLNNSGMKDSQYRERMRVALMTQQLQNYLAKRVPDRAEQVHLHIIVIKEYKEALDVVERLKAGEDFGSVAREVSIDPGSKDKGGDIGWVPVSVSIFKDMLASTEINEIVGPLPYYPNAGGFSRTNKTEPDAFNIIKVSERDKSRLVPDSFMEVLKANALQEWLQEEVKNHEIKYNFNSEIYAWINWQLQKRGSSSN